MALSRHPVAASLSASDTGKVVSARDAVRLISDGDTVATGGFVGIGFAENIAIALEPTFFRIWRFCGKRRFDESFCGIRIFATSE